MIMCGGGGETGGGGGGGGEKTEPQKTKPQPSSPPPGHPKPRNYTTFAFFKKDLLPLINIKMWHC